MEERLCPECDGHIDVATGTCVECGFDGMNEGDYHSGPYGYSPGTAYPNTQYGSGFDEDEEWNR
jgi:hypothetical protein